MSQTASTVIEDSQTAFNDVPLPDGWRRVRLGDVCVIIAGQSPPSETYSKTPAGLPFFQGKADFGERHPIARTWCTAPNKIALSGDILISVRAPVGPTNIADVECCIGRGLAAIRPSDLADRDFILAALRFYETRLVKLGSGSTFGAINRDVLESLEIPFPPLGEQKRIATILNEQMAAVERARAAAEAQLKAAKELPVAYLRAVFVNQNIQKWEHKRLDEIGNLLPSKSIATNGDTQVLAITTACLDEIGFQPAGIKTARMWAFDAEQCKVAKGEVLIARSNTAELVGRAAMFTGEPQDVVASDLTIRYMPHSDTFSPFIAAYLSFLYASGYWKERAGGASGSMKKITRPQILHLTVPVPSISEQNHITELLRKQMQTAKQVQRHLREQRDSIINLPAALLRQAFTGKL